jgi:PAS domain-containing protein
VLQVIRDHQDRCIATDKPRMDGSQPRKRRTAKPGLRALEACGDGFWELDLKDGSAWYSEWFYQKLDWPAETKRTTLGDLESRLAPAAWTGLVSRIREHLEQGRPLDLELEVAVGDGSTRRWQIRGSAQRNRAGQPEHLAGSMREVADRTALGACSDLLGVRSAFDALPVAAALLDARAVLLEANRQWHELPAATTAHALARLRAANSHTAIEFWVDQGEGFDAGPRRLRVRAVAFQHQGARHLTVTLEDRRSD